MVSAVVRDKVKTIPAQPGVYLWKSDQGQILYVGKAQNLRARVAQYLGSQEDARKVELMERSADVDFIAVDSEKEALVLEQTLIKQHRPPYNVLLVDDKKYPYIAVTQEVWPRVVYTRDTTRSGQFFGPFPDAGSAKRVARLLNKTFQLRQCRVLPKRECLYYHLHQCTAPCIGAVGPDAYAGQVRQSLEFLQGRGRELVDRARHDMAEAADRLQFERAAELRDLAEAVQSVLERQRVDVDLSEDVDAVALATRADRACAVVLPVRNGKVVGRESYSLSGVSGTRTPQILAAFLEQYYVNAPRVPREVLVPIPVDEPELIEEFLSARRGLRVRLRTPERGPRRGYVGLAEQNAHLLLEQEFALRERRGSGALEELQRLLSLPDSPSRIEAFDVSHHAGQYTVASLVVFREGRPYKNGYRHFRIRTTGGGDDPGALREAVERRYVRVLAEEGADALPDLILIDGGRVQLEAALESLRRLGLEELPTVGLAKRFEEVYRPRLLHPLRIEPTSPALQLLRHVRDEAHRFAIGYQGKLKRKEFIRSELDSIPGVGPERRRRLLSTFGSVEGLRSATPEEIARVPGIHRPLARRIHRALSGQGEENPSG